MKPQAIITAITILTAGLFNVGLQGSDTLSFLKTTCVDCHQGDEPAGNLDFAQFRKPKDLLAQPQLLLDILTAIDTSLMPPEDSDTLSKDARHSAVKNFRELLHAAIQMSPPGQPVPMRRMTRFQYSNAVRDLFDLKITVFTLPEQMVREYGNYYQPSTGKMPDVVTVGNRPLGKSQLIEPRLTGVTAYPQDLRAEHGFDNQADQLSVSPLLLEQFMELSRSIVNASNFNNKTVGVWNEVFAVPDTDVTEWNESIANRLQRVLTLAFREKVSETTVKRFAEYARTLIDSGADFTTAMRNTVAAILASPRFFYLHDHADPQFAIASRLSFFLWGSIPDQALLASAEKDELTTTAILESHVDRMLLDRKSKRFCDSFPRQWLQLDNIISSAPDPEVYRQFYFARYNTSMHMAIEPLLLFETVLIEDKSILQFIHSDFSYRSTTLKMWYAKADKIQHSGPATLKFERVPITDMRQGGMITNTAIMTMTSASDHTKPITRGAWFAATILHSPPKPPPADVPTIDRKANAADENLTIREQLALHRDNASCAGCHKTIDPLGFALENFDPVGQWREQYENGKPVNASGVLYNQHAFDGIVELKSALLTEQERFAYAFSEHLLSFALGRRTTYRDTISLEQVVKQAGQNNYQIKTVIKSLVLSPAFLQVGQAPAGNQLSIKGSASE